MKYRVPYLILLIGILFNSCSKEEHEGVYLINDKIPLACLDKFFTYERRIIFEESFNDNSNGWDLGGTTPGDCTPWLPYTGTIATIDSNLLLQGGCSETDTAFAYLTLQSDSTQYLAAEVKFNEFWITRDDFNFLKDGCLFEFASGKYALSIERDVDNGFAMNLGGHTVHFLLDQKEIRLRAFSDEFIEHSPGFLNQKIDDENLSALLWIRKLDEEKTFITFLSHASTADVNYSVWRTNIESITLYEPIFPCE